MPSLLVWCQWLEGASIGIWGRGLPYGFPMIEKGPFFWIGALGASTSVLDLRFWGVVFREEPVSRLVARLVPWAWTGFAVQVVTGFLLFSSEATRCYGNHAFEIKMLLILLAGVNMLVFHTSTYKRV